MGHNFFESRPVEGGKIEEGWNHESFDGFMEHVRQYKDELARDIIESENHIKQLGGREYLEELEEELNKINEWEKDVDSQSIEVVNNLKKV